MFVLQLLWKVENKVNNNNRKGILEALTYYGVCGLNILGAALVFADMMRCFLQQVKVKPTGLA